MIFFMSPEKRFIVIVFATSRLIIARETIRSFYGTRMFAFLVLFKFFLGIIAPCASEYITLETVLSLFIWSAIVVYYCDD